MSHVEEIPITKVAISHVIGPGGSVIKKLKADTNTSIEIVDDSTVKVTGEEEDCKKARKLIEDIINEQANPDYEGPEGKRLRAEADAIGKKRDELKKEAQEKFNAGDKDAGHALMAEVSKHTTMLHEKNKEAAAAILKNRNEGKGEAYLDLHGLRTEEALDATKQRLAELEQKPEGTHTELELIPGAGHHSAPGQVALKPACADLLNTLGLKFTNHTAGSFLVTVPGKGADNKRADDTKHQPLPAAETHADHPAPTATTTHEENKKQPDASTTEQKEEAPVHKAAESKKDEKAKGGCCIIM